MIRRATSADVPALAGLEEDNFGVDAWPSGLVEQGVSGELPTVHYWVAEADGRVVGHAVFSIVSEIAELQRISVESGRRRTGVASDLLRTAVDRARAEGADRMLLEVREDNGAARALYGAWGFDEVERRLRYYRDGAAAVVLMLDLTS